MCIGYMDKMHQQERYERMINYNIVKGWADPKKFSQTPERWWPIAGDVVVKMKRPSKAKLLKINSIFKNLGKNG